MENNLPVMTKKVWNWLCVAYVLLRKGISKSKLALELNLIMKRGKLAGKAISNLMFHHHHGGESASSSSARRPQDNAHLSFPVGADDYEFSCSNSPAFPKRRRNHYHSSFFKCAHAPDTLDDDATAVNAVKAVMEMLNNNGASVQASPALPGFGRSPFVRQLRVTDSPFPLEDNNADPRVDKDADEFISRFYKELRRQTTDDG